MCSIHRLDFGEEKRRKKEEYDTKEREQAIKKARDQRLKDQKVMNIPSILPFMMSTGTYIYMYTLYVHHL